MIIVLRPEATEAQVNHIIDKVKALGLTPHVSKGASRTIIGVIGPEDVLRMNITGWMASGRVKSDPQ